MDSIFGRKPVTLKEYALWANLELAKNNARFASNPTEAYSLQAVLSKAKQDYDTGRDLSTNKIDLTKSFSIHDELAKIKTQEDAIECIQFIVAPSQEAYAAEISKKRC